MKLRFFAYFFTIVAALLALPSCETSPSSSDNSEWRRPPRYGSGGSQSRSNSSSSRSNSSSSRNSGSSRFGYSGNERDRSDSNSSSSSRDREEDDAPEEKPKKEEAKKEPASSGDSGNLGYAIGVPGKPLSVTLPGSAKSLGPISIEKYDASGNPTGEPLPRGTPVEIPDPNNPGKKIQFKVP